MSREQPDKSNPDAWDEFDWERSLRESDDYARRYFQLLERFNDLPGVNELISAYLGYDGGEEGDCDFDCDQCEDRWSCEWSMADEWDLSFDRDEEEEEAEADFLRADEFDKDLDGDLEEGGDNLFELGDSFFYERDDRFKDLRRVALGWCNVYAAVLPRQSRAAGLKILFHLGRGLGNLSYSIGEDGYEYSAASAAYAKRSLGHLNRALGLLRQMAKEHPRLAPLMGAMSRHILEARGGVFDHLRKCREENGK